MHMIEAHADPRSEALCRSPMRGGGAQNTDATRRERERVERRTSEMQNRTVEPRAWRGGAVGSPACARAHGTSPPVPRGVPACGPRSQVDHRSKYKRMILRGICLLDAYYTPSYTPVPKYRGSPDASSKHLSHTLNTQHRLDRQHTAVCMRGTPAADARAAASASQSHSLECRGPRTATGALGRGPGPAQ